MKSYFFIMACSPRKIDLYNLSSSVLLLFFFCIFTVKFDYVSSKADFVCCTSITRVIACIMYKVGRVIIHLQSQLQDFNINSTPNLHARVFSDIICCGTFIYTHTLTLLCTCWTSVYNIVHVHDFTCLIQYKCCSQSLEKKILAPFIFFTNRYDHLKALITLIIVAHGYHWNVFMFNKVFPRKYFACLRLPLMIGQYCIVHCLAISALLYVCILYSTARINTCVCTARINTSVHQFKARTAIKLQPQCLQACYVCILYPVQPLTQAFKWDFFFFDIQSG